jgi:lactose/L-arabinose transport system ATP-binding protein
VKLTGRAQVVEQLGGVSYIYAVGEGGAQLTVQQRGHSDMATDSMVEFGVDPKTMLLFDADGRRI